MLGEFIIYVKCMKLRYERIHAEYLFKAKYLVLYHSNKLEQLLIRISHFQTHGD